MWTGGGNTYYVTSAHAGNLFIGDPVIVTGSADAAGVPTVDIATAGATNYFTGAILGFVPDPTILANGYLPASTAGYVIVEDDPNVTYEIQASTLALADLNANSILAAGTGNRTTGSGWFMDTATKGTSNTYQLRIVGIAQAPDNALGQYCKAHVRINLPTEAGLPTGTGF
jgi:hypothetical protein